LKICIGRDAAGIKYNTDFNEIRMNITLNKKVRYSTTYYRSVLADYFCEFYLYVFFSFINALEILIDRCQATGFLLSASIATVTNSGSSKIDNDIIF
jgi:hypothetical protein